jgi:hypothetical protein
VDYLERLTELVLRDDPWQVEVVKQPPPYPNHPALTREQLGIVATWLALHFPIWVRRRKTEFTYVDDTTIRQRMSVDFRLPPAEDLPLHARPALGQTVFVPLYIAEKTALVGFSIRNEGGDAVSLLNRHANGSLATAGLFALVNGLSGRNGRPEVDPEALRTAVNSVVLAPEGSGAVTAKKALKRDEPLGQLLAANDVLRALVTDLALGFLMLVPLAYDPGRDRCLKIEFETQQDWHSFGDRTPRVTRLLGRALPALGLTAKKQGIPDLQVGWAQGTHFEFKAPDEVQLGVARLDTRQLDQGTLKDFPERRVVYDRPSINLQIGPRMHFDPFETDAMERTAVTAAVLRSRQDTATVELRLRASPSYVLLPTAMASLLTTALLVGAALQLGSLDGQTSAAVLLLFPAVVVAYLTRPGEHAFVARLLRGVRLLGAVVGVCAVVTVAVIGGGVIRSDAASRADRGVDCQLVSVLPPTLRCITGHQGPVRPSARIAVWSAAGVAALATVLLLLGLASTQLAQRSWRRKTDSEKDGVVAAPRAEFPAVAADHPCRLTLGDSDDEPH